MDNIAVVYTELAQQILSAGAIIVITCAMVGYTVKNILSDSKQLNQFIPAFNMLLGGILGCMLSTLWGADSGTITHFIYGAICGFSSSLLYDYLGKPIMQHVISPLLEKLKNSGEA